MNAAMIAVSILGNTPLIRFGKAPKSSAGLQGGARNSRSPARGSGDSRFTGGAGGPLFSAGTPRVRLPTGQTSALEISPDGNYPHHYHGTAVKLIDGAERTARRSSGPGTNRVIQGDGDAASDRFQRECCGRMLPILRSASDRRHGRGDRFQRGWKATAIIR